MHMYSLALVLVVSTSYAMDRNKPYYNSGIKHLTQENIELKNKCSDLQKRNDTLVIENKNLMGFSEKNKQLVQEAFQKNEMIKKLTEERDTYQKASLKLSGYVVSSDKKDQANKNARTKRDFWVALFVLGSAIGLQELYAYLVAQDVIYKLI